MTQGETVVQTGGGAQTGASRWGDYATMNIDPVDDCTFWFTTEFIGTTGWAPWQTRIVSFQLPGCSGVPTPAPTINTNPTPSPTLDPTQQPTLTQPGQCGLPYTLNLGANAFNNAPASGETVSVVGTSCDFGTTGELCK